MFYFSHPEFHTRNLNFVISILLENDYSLKFIFETLNDRIKKFKTIQLYGDKTSINIVEKEYIRWFTISFINGIFNKFCKFINGICYRVIAHYSINKLNKFIRIPKDPLPKFAKRNVVYQIDVAMIPST